MFENSFPELLKSTVPSESSRERSRSCTESCGEDVEGIEDGGSSEVEEANVEEGSQIPTARLI